VQEEPVSDTHDESVSRLRDLIKDVKVAMLCTVEADGCLRSRPMMTQKTDFNGQLWFFTGLDSAKVHEVEREHHVNVSYASPDKDVYVSVSGMARLTRDRAKLEELWNPIHKAWFPKGLDDPNIALLCVDVDKAEYWDAPSGKLVQLAGFVKALATGEPYRGEGSEHGQVRL